MGGGSSGFCLWILARGLNVLLLIVYHPTVACGLAVLHLRFCIGFGISIGILDTILSFPCYTISV